MNQKVIQNRSRRSCDVRCNNARRKNDRTNRTHDPTISMPLKQFSNLR